MKKSNLVAMFLAFFSLTSAWADLATNGEFTMPDSQTLTLMRGKIPVVFTNGYGRAAINKNKTLVLKQTAEDGRHVNSVSVRIPGGIPRFSPYNFIIEGARVKQPVDMVGKSVETDLGIIVRDYYEYCVVAVYCDDPFDCYEIDGERRVTEKSHVYNEELTINFSPAGANPDEVIATFHGNLERTQIFKRRVGRCY